MSQPTPITGSNGRAVIATTGTAVTLPSASGVKAICVTAILNIPTLNNGENSEYILVGVGEAPTWSSSYTGTPLARGESLMINMDETNDVYINGVAGDGVTYTYIY